MRRGRNRIVKILDDEGVWVDGDLAIRKAFENYYMNLFSTSGVRPWGRSSPHMQPTIMHAMNSTLCSPFSIEDREAAFQLGTLKAPGLDGLPGLFYHKF
ncbi:hypothetical protein COP2_007285 [Malus domestica]